MKHKKQLVRIQIDVSVLFDARHSPEDVKRMVSDGARSVFRNNRGVMNSIRYTHENGAFTVSLPNCCEEGINTRMEYFLAAYCPKDGSAWGDGTKSKLSKSHECLAWHVHDDIYIMDCGAGTEPDLADIGDLVVVRYVWTEEDNNISEFIKGFGYEDAGLAMVFAHKTK